MPIFSEKLVVKRSNPLIRLPRKWINDYFTDMDQDRLVVIREADGNRIVISMHPNQKIPGDSDNDTSTNN